MREPRYGAETLVETDRERSEDYRAVGRRTAVEGFLHMFEAGLHRDTMARKQRELRRAPRQALQGRKAVLGCQLADRIHPRVKIEW